MPTLARSSSSSDVKRQARMSKSINHLATADGLFFEQVDGAVRLGVGPLARLNVSFQ